MNDGSQADLPPSWASSDKTSSPPSAWSSTPWSCGTRYLDAVVAQLRTEGHDIKDEDLARLSPLKDRHINFLGRYLFNITASGPGQGLRPLRDPDAFEDDADDEG
nr:transposase [Streptomyces roseifaciens]